MSLPVRKIATHSPRRSCNEIAKRHATLAASISPRVLFGLAQFCGLIGLLAAYSRNFTRLKTAEELGVPTCIGDADCVYGGVCERGKFGGANRCLCSSSCPLSVPVQCTENNDYSCMTMGYAYTTKYDLRSPVCYYKRCICPPAFDANVLQPPIAGFTATLPMKCDRRELRAMIVASPSDAVYKGTEANIYCCVNVDPRTFVSQNGVYFVQNGTRKIEPTTTPYENFSRDIDTLFTVPTCWILHVSNAQLSDNGIYACIVQPTSPRYPTVNVSMEFIVKNSSMPVFAIKKSADVSADELLDVQVGVDADIVDEDTVSPPELLQNLQIVENTTSAIVTWSTPESSGHVVSVDFTLFDRYVKAKEVWRQMNARSPVLIDGLQPGTPYTLFITMHDADGRQPPTGQIPFSRQFSTKSTSPDPPPLDAIRLVNSENGVGQLCEIEWRPAHREREFITRYYVKISGRLRYVSPELQAAENAEEAALAEEDYPPGAESCVNYYRDADKYINATIFHKRFLSCKYGPLKPNRNYSASVWVENEAGRSRPAIFESQCVTDFSEPDYIAAPAALARANMSSFQLHFNERPNEKNGPIVCYYLAIVPLPTNVSLDSLPSPELIVMDTFDKALQNNLQPFAIVQKRFFAYIAESYMQYPQHNTVVGDGNVSGGAERCSVLYLARHKPMDPALTPNLKYTGFLIARVDRDRSLQAEHTAPALSGDGRSAALMTSVPTVSGNMPRPLVGRGMGTLRSNPRRPPRAVDNENALVIPLSAAADEPTSGRTSFAHLRRRQLANFDPAYGFSDYFESVVLNENSDGISVGLLVAVLLLLFLVLLLAVVLYFVCRHRRDKVDVLRAHLARVYAHVRWTRSKHDLLRTAPPQPIRVDELANEYVMRHRDSNFHFSQEFEMIPTGRDLDHTTCDRNPKKNRYGDIKAYEATRVRLRKIPGDPNSDYINANFIKGYKSRKVFIATQAPLENTIDDFWRMIWEQGTRIIVMVTNLRERNRDHCVKYWPDEERNPLVSRKLEVHSLKTTYFAEYALREFEVSELPSSDGAGDTTYANGGIRALSALGSDTGSRPSSAMRADSATETVRSSSKCGYYQNADLPRERRRVFQYHFTCWPDCKAPECVHLLRLMGKLRKLDDYNSTPVVVHCSAGVGRTGTLIAIDYLMDQCQEEGRVDVFKCVSEMRQQRNIMVQSVEQYAFVYKALAEYQIYGDTDLSDQEFRGYYTRLRMPLNTFAASGGDRERHCSVGSTRSSARSNSIIGAQSLADRSTASKSADSASTRGGILLSNTASISAGIKAKLRLVRNSAAGSVAAIVNGTTGGRQGGAAATAAPGMTLLDAEFNNLSISLEKPRATDWAQKPENVARNRDLTHVPFDVNRVVLSHFTGYDCYINASEVKGYFYPYILAQDPLDADTAFDFWRMISDKSAHTIVQLTPDDVFSHTERYWPAGGRDGDQLTLGRHGELVITLLSVSNIGGNVDEPAFIARRLHYRFTNEKDSPDNEVVQYAFRQWRTPVTGITESAVPRNTVAFLDLVMTILERHSQASNGGHAIIHCRNGSARSGVCCAVSLLLERLKSEHMIDVFRTAKDLKAQRQHIFDTVDEYGFLFDCVMEYIGGAMTSTQRFRRFS